ncbi:MAG: Ig-like domain-containing protein [Ignavibacteriales bacterium]|nr:Ig-like domain-containing protein [Ignavibacteriales bacterium]MCB9219310.1 Ig-like domain-containing protein [Ignavibacteriales bacterium]MCB9260197.1 Ig-like domain-containing protein [Ignavibacteriales bacterium]
MARKQQIKIIGIVIFVAFIFVKCANQMSPPGGDIDKVPPIILSTYPENGTTNFSENSIEFTFSEYVNKRNINDAFFISPLYDGYPEFSWTNKTVYISFPDSLNPNTTYSVIIGTEITDVNNNNNMKEPFILTFSTGSKIDSGKISGKVYTEKSEGTLIFAYKIDTGFVNIYKEKPSYLSQINNKGNYELNGLGNGSYLLFAVKDAFKDLIYNIGDDFIGIPNKIAEITHEKNALSNFNFFIHKEDTLAPNVQSVTMTDKNHIIVEFNEPIDSSKISINNFSIFDSTMNASHPIKYWFNGNPNKHQYILCLTDSLNVKNEFYLYSKNFVDKKGNFTKLEITSFVASEKPDTNEIKIDKIETGFTKSEIDYLKPNFSVSFSDAFNSDLIDNAVKFYTRDSVSIPIKISPINYAKYEVFSESSIKPKENYFFQVDMKHLSDAAGNIVDTVLSKRIVTVNDLDFSGASGFVNKANYENIKVILQEDNKPSSRKQINLATNNTFNFERVIPGKYLIWAYVDADSNNSYSYGLIDTLKFAEVFKFYPDTLNLRARWPVGDIEIDFTK